MGLSTIYRNVRGRFRFYRHHSSYELQWARVYYAQYGEDVFLHEYFKGKRDGLYVDIGAFHPVAYSNTYMFYRSGWSGINVEPNSKKFPLFVRHRPRDITLPVAVSAATGTAKFAVDEGLSGIVDQNYFHRQHLGAIRQIAVQTRPLHAILKEHIRPVGRPIDFLSVDCEGHDQVVLQSNDWEQFRPLVLLCEAFDTDGAERLRRFAESQSYSQVARCGPTLVFEDGRARADRPQGY